MRLLARLLGATVAAIAVLVGVVVLSSRLWLDGDNQHTSRTESLPLWGEQLPTEQLDTPGATPNEPAHAAARAAPLDLVRIPARGMHFRARVAGMDRNGPGLILLHGFPETSIMWEPLMPAAAALGFRVVAFDQRGYSPGARPEQVAAYQLAELTADVFAIADAVGFDRFHLVGHDWGSIVGWVAAAEAPDRIVSYGSLSIPHPSAIRIANQNRETPAYVRFFQMDGVPETLFTAGNAFVMRRFLYGEMPPNVLAEYLGVFSEPGALRAALSWYRARSALDWGDESGWEVTQPVLYAFGNRDLPIFVRPEVRSLNRQFATGPFEEIELDAGHWLIQERPNETVAAITQHLRAQLR